jgi:ribonuclease J
VHVSGHAHRDEQRQLIELVRPRAFLPVHGTYMHLRAHAEIAREAGVPEVVFVENGGIVEVDEQGTRVSPERVPSGRTYVDHHEPVAERVIHDRTLLAQLGVVFVSLPVDRAGRTSAEPQVVSRGVVDEEAEPELLADLRAEIRDAVDAIRTPELGVSDDLLRDTARRAVRRFFGRELGRKPLCYVVPVRTP